MGQVTTTTREQSPKQAVGVSRNVQIGVLITDALALALATFIGFITRFSFAEIETSLTGPIQLVGTIAPLLWLGVLVLIGSYEQRIFGLGLTEYGRILQSALWMVALVSIVSFLGKFDTSRAYVLLVIPIGTALLLIDRWLWRRWLLRKRVQGRELQSTIIIGAEADRDRISASLRERPWAGYTVVAEFDPAPSGPIEAGSASNEWMDALMHRVETEQIMCIALSPTCGLSGADIRELSWRIEGRGIDLLISSALGAVTGPRLSLRVATGLPFMHLDEVGLGVIKRAVKRTLDITVSALTLVVLSPVLLLIALLVLITSGSPVFFSQDRAGQRGELFRMWKFRTMVRDADQQREALREATNTEGPVAKFVDDPRITPFGRFLRRWSLDELPQLFNVLRGDMSLVGPRPHPVDDVERYRSSDVRRLLAKPGMTGLWQVAGRSDLSWDDAVELDLLYIENWSVLADIAILIRTVQAVITRSGAY
jgi:exopolysaccharide biosynthesis polyprenyl glycosylphosphotransferase